MTTQGAAGSIDEAASSAQAGREFTDFDIRTAKGQKRGINAVPFSSGDEKVGGVFNWILNRLGYGYVEVKPETGPRLKVNVSSARKYLKEHAELLGAMGIVIDPKEKSSGSFSPDSIKRIVIGLKTKTTPLDERKKADLKNFGMLQKDPELTAYVATIGLTMPTRGDVDKISEFMNKTLPQGCVRKSKDTAKTGDSASTSGSPSEVGREAVASEEKKSDEIPSFEEIRKKVEDKFFEEKAAVVIDEQKRNLLFLNLPTVPRTRTSLVQEFPKLGTGTKIEIFPIDYSPDKVHRFLSDVRDKIDSCLESLPKKLRGEFDRAKLLRCDQEELFRLDCVMENMVKWETSALRRKEAISPSCKGRDIEAFITKKRAERNSDAIKP